MKTYIRGAKHSKLSLAGVRRAVEFYAERLGMTQRLRDKITLFITIEHEPFGFAGLCTWHDEPCRPKEFTLQVFSQGIHETLSTLAHEMVHVKQYATGQLRDLMSKNDMVVWQGVRKTLADDTADYASQPWEAEAFSREASLKNAFIYQEKKHGRW
jgi:hypothetical protein